jgi:hypothetical protein
MRRDLRIEEPGDLLELPLLAVLATYRRDGSALLSPSGTNGMRAASTSSRAETA